MSELRVIAVDPGLHGAAGCLAGTSIQAFDLPIVGKEIDAAEFARLVRELAPTLAVIERVNAFPKQGVSSVWTFASAYSATRAVIATLGIPQTLVAPTVWKKHFRLPGGDKEAARAMAIRLWPDCGLFSRVKDHNKSEACLLARYAIDVIARGGQP